MARFIGHNAYINFGSTVLSTDYRTFSQGGTADVIDKTAGADTHKTYLVGPTDDTVSMELLLDGTAAWAACAQGTEGTLTIAPEGTASGKYKTTAVATVSKRDRKFAYNDVAMMSIDFVMSTAPQEGTYA